MIYVFLFITLLVLIVQTVHSWYVFDGFSTIEITWLKRFQSIMFCGILSIFIIATVWIGRTEFAIAAAVLETLINIYYYAQDFFDKGFKAFTGDRSEIKRKRRNSILVFWRRYWLKFIFAGTFPVLIYYCSELIIELR